MLDQLIGDVVTGELDTAVVRSILETRAAMGREVARLAAKRGGPDLARALRSVVGALAAAADNPIEQQRQALEYWDLVVDGADSIVYRLMFNGLRTACEPALAALSTVMAAEVGRVNAYVRLADAVAASDEQEAMAAAEDLLAPWGSGGLGPQNHSGAAPAKVRSTEQGPPAADESAGKPDSVPGLVGPGGGHPSRPAVADRLVRPTRRLGRAALVACAGARGRPLGLAPGGVYLATPVTRGAGGLLHHRFTLTSALRAGAVCFLWHCPASCLGLPLATTLPCGVRTFLDSLSLAAAALPTRPRTGYLTVRDWLPVCCPRGFTRRRQTVTGRER
ncbi:hypothetical protein AOZ06_07395 [Kibdelosporangium phytohabitans]|uniref:GntR C-terminal domain-containing protein n=1 Tax=Kibdelosporangium phytohabitans TaxID=860235 RepID=A0A0N9HTX1_9PSEU|nr:hypothetical protein AOZ06_07395 [Kibdelosporangium phytohabitans]